jgi:hypothetical protein
LKLPAQVDVTGSVVLTPSMYAGVLSQGRAEHARVARASARVIDASGLAEHDR